jgi:hypothetical protein
MVDPLVVQTDLGAPMLQAPHDRDSSVSPGVGALGANTMAVLARTYPELDALTPDATFREIQTRYGLDNLEAVREFARRRSEAAGVPRRLTR